MNLCHRSMDGSSNSLATSGTTILSAEEISGSGSFIALQSPNSENSDALDSKPTETASNHETQHDLHENDSQCAASHSEALHNKRTQLRNLNSNIRKQSVVLSSRNSTFCSPLPSGDRKLGASWQIWQTQQILHMLSLICTCFGNLNTFQVELLIGRCCFVCVWVCTGVLTLKCADMCARPRAEQSID